MVTITCIPTIIYKNFLQVPWIGYYVIDWNTINNTWNIRKQTAGYIMLLKRKESAKVKAKGCVGVEGHHSWKFNHKSKSISLILPSCFHIGSYVMNILDYNYKLRSVIGREDNFTTNKWKWFDTQVRDTFLWSWMISRSRSLVDYTDTGRIIGSILGNVYEPPVSLRDSIRSIFSYFHTSMVIHTGSNGHLPMCNIIHGNIRHVHGRHYMYCVLLPSPSWWVHGYYHWWPSFHLERRLPLSW